MFLYYEGDKKHDPIDGQRIIILAYKRLQYRDPRKRYARNA